MEITANFYIIFETFHFCLLSDIRVAVIASSYQTNFNENQQKPHFEQNIHICGAKSAILSKNPVLNS